MKAKEIASKILENLPQNTLIVPIEAQLELVRRASNHLTLMVGETAQLAERRQVQTPAGWAGVVAEQHNKWRAVVRLVNKRMPFSPLNTNWYLVALKQATPTGYEAAIEGGFTHKESTVD